MLPRVLALLLVGLAVPPAARAWTRAEVRDVHAQLDVDDQGNAHVVMDVGLKVMGGWISELSLAGLGDDLVLDADKPPTMWERDGDAKFTPEVRVQSGGVLRLSFPKRRRAPWRGRYTLRVHYTTRLGDTACDGCNGRAVGWTLPPWPENLEDVVVEVWAPAGTRPVVPPGMEEERLTVVSQQRGRLSLITLRRAQLPRTTPWNVDLELPDRDAPPARETVVAEAAPGLTGPWALALAMALACLLKLSVVRRRALREGLAAVPLLWLPSPAVRAVLVLALCATAAALPDEQRGASVALMACAVALSLHRRLAWARAAAGSPQAPAPRLAHLGAASRQARLHELLGLDAWLDATTPLGAALAVAVTGLTLAADRAGLACGWLPHGLLLGAPLWLTSTRLHGPPTTARALALLQRGARRLRADGVPARATTLPTPGGGVPALSIVLRRAPEGLRSLHLVAASREWLGYQRGELALLVTAGAGSEAAVRLSRGLGAPENAGDPVVRWLVGGPELVKAALDALRAEDGGAEVARAA